MLHVRIRKPIYIIAIISILLVSPVFAQPENPNTDPDTVPISGLELLLGAGALLGVKKLLGKKTEEKNSLNN